MKKLKTILLIGITFNFLKASSQTQLAVGSDPNSLVIKNGEVFHFDGLTLTPSGSDFVLANTTLSKTDANSINPAPSGTYIARYYSFSNTTPSFSGTIRFSYSGANLNGLSAGALQLNIRTNTAWTGGFGTDVGAGGGSYVEATSLSSTGLNTLTLAANGSALPVTWLSFVGEKKQGTTLLSWSTATEENSQDFLVQHSLNGSIWKTLNVVKAAGIAISRRDYTYVHNTPSTGFNYYRLIQRDINGKYDYSKVVSVMFEKTDIKLKAFPNPVLNGRLNLILKEQQLVRVFDSRGVQVLAKFLGQGLQVVDVSGLPGGVYQLNAGSETISIILKNN